MEGRYGPDQLGFVMIGASILLNLIGSFTRFGLLSLVSLVILILCFLRMFSRNVRIITVPTGGLFLRMPWRTAFSARTWMLKAGT